MASKSPDPRAVHHGSTFVRLEGRKMPRDSLERLVITAWALLFLVGLPILVALAILRAIGS